MYEKIVEVTAKDNYQLMAVFDNGEARIYDARPILSEIDAFLPLREQPERFFSVKPVCCGSAVAWDDTMDIASEEIWENGMVVDRD